MDEISINLVSTETLDNLEGEEKIRYILDEVKNGKVLILERGLYPIEEAKLIETTMMEIDHETFIGIEMQSYNREDVKKGNWLKKLLMRKLKPRMSVIGPADLLKTIRKDGKGIQAMILTKEFIVREKEKEQIIDKSQKHLDYWFDEKSIIENSLDIKEENLSAENKEDKQPLDEIEKEISKFSLLKRFANFRRKKIIKK